MFWITCYLHEWIWVISYLLEELWVSSYLPEVLWVLSFLPEVFWVISYLPKEFWVSSYLTEVFWVSSYLPEEFWVAAWLSLVCSAGETSVEPHVACSPLLAPLSSLLVRQPEENFTCKFLTVAMLFLLSLDHTVIFCLIHSMSPYYCNPVLTLTNKASLLSSTHQFLGLHSGRSLMLQGFFLQTTNTK